ncbi:Gmad2 immunoglobulin-like domain-containing protein [Angustibacter sp. McL0619]|uniref:Gmad2 immunoglobulin-like domain-containing protein n=1 Tax=Angustibacter sp. McL0619 TaxID=3415676 RepID=UPI003CF27AF6
MKSHADGRPGKLFDQLPVGSVLHRTDPAYEVLGSIWVQTPGEGQVVGSPVTVQGSACTFEANVAWQLFSGSQVVRSGHTTASIACPERGSWTVDLGDLAPGSYTFRAFDPPASGQGPDREDTRVFVVR